MAATDDISTEVVQLKEDLVNLRSDLGALMGAVKELGVEQGRVVQSRVREVGERARGQAVAARQSMEQYIETRPIASVFIALGTGFVIGTLLTNRR